ncbi:integral membrane protein [Myxozyma melibiosi]|uniref:Integral membrane protein n=1 Tax=Myxozyma melibiosi TaxID=54550 RepID=A0ABR1F369_9ASCO
MRVQALFLAAACFGGALANQAKIVDEPSGRQQCSGMYARSDWGGKVDPYIKVDIHRSATSTSSETGTVSVVVFEWTDVDLIGIDTGDSKNPVAYVCSEDAVKNKLCTQDHFGEFLLRDAGDDSTVRSIVTKAVEIHDGFAEPLTYQVHRTGFYCVGTYGITTDDGGYAGTVTFQNAYGQLPASQVAKLPFYGGMAIAYAVMLAYWMFLYVQYRSDILAVQNYITACAVFLTVEMIIVWGYYDLINSKGYTPLSRVYMVFIAILNAFRNAFTFFLLLIVCMGYGVVKPSLGSSMTKCRILAGLHFVFGIVYAIASFLVTPDTAGPLILLVIMPLAATMTAFYLWILSSLTATIKDLVERKQNVKALMYRRLWRLLFGSILVIFAFFFVNSLIFADRSSADFVPRHWKSRWFVLDGWLNVIYFLDFVLIAFLWRPTRNNRRFAMSDELSQDDDGGFEIASLAGSLDEEAGIPSRYDPASTNSGSGAGVGRYDGDNDSLAGSLHAGTTNPYGDDGAHGSVEVAAGDGPTTETMFEAPDEDYDRWSEDDDDYATRLNGSKKGEDESELLAKKKEPGKDD